MPLWLPIAAAVAFFAAMGSREHEAKAERKPAPPPNPPAPASGVSVPEFAQALPIEALCAYLRAGQEPPRELAVAAHREAEGRGLFELAADIAHAFLAASASAPAPRAEAQPGSLPPQSGAIGADFHSDAIAALATDHPVDAAAAAHAQAVADAMGDASAAMTPAAPAPPATFAGVDPAAWAAFVDQLRREPPTHDSQRHIGQYRQDKRRLAELGIDAASLVGRPDLQDAALVADLVDADHHLTESGVYARTIGRSISLPDVDEAEAITRSGLLGICAAAGLEHCASWLASKGDRRRFRHTTNLYLRCNGKF